MRFRIFYVQHVHFYQKSALAIFLPGKISIYHSSLPTYFYKKIIALTEEGESCRKAFFIIFYSRVRSAADKPKLSFIIYFNGIHNIILEAVGTVAHQIHYGR